jgi:hypothetical protein
MLRACLEILLGALCLAACARSPQKPAMSDTEVASARAACEPAYILVSKDPIAIRPDPYVELGGRVALVGCRSDLEKIDLRQRDAIVERFAALLEEKNFALQKVAESPDFRRSFVTAVNGIIGRPVVTDVLIYGLYSKDFG